DRTDSPRIDRILQCAELMLEHGADPNTFFMLGEEKETALYAACGVVNNSRLSELLIGAGADVNDEDASYHVAEFDEHDCIRVLFENGMDAKRRATVLLRKLDFADYQGVETILKLGTDPNEMGVWGKTALHQAIVRGRDIETIKLLLNHNVDPDLPCSDGKTPYVLAARHGRRDVMELLAADGANDQITEVSDQVVALCATGDEAGLQVLASEQGDIALRISAEDRTAICEAAKFGNLATLRLMLIAGFSVDTQDEQGFSPLHWAAWYGHIDSVNFLIEQKAPLELQNNYGGTVIDGAVWGWINSDGDATNGQAILNALVNAGADIEAVSPFPSGNLTVDSILVELGKNQSN
ncbi:ankyrin repeat domain-containing protein, partial [Vicingaceae bacterium]|nr:ankyrin repeat domain-containing protein [Vicingaceae bacterium]